MTTGQKIIKYFAIAFAFSLIIGIFAGVLKGATLISKISDFTTYDGVVEDVQPDSDITKLRVNLFRTNMVIVEGDEFNTETNNGDVTVKERFGTLIIEENSKSIVESAVKTEVVLTVPKGFVFEKVSASTGAGNFEAEILAAKKVDLQFGAGAVEIDKLISTEHTEIDGGAGKIEIRDGQTNNLDLDMGVGKLIYRAHITGESEIDCGIGAMDLTLLGNEADYTVELDKGLGVATINGNTVGDSTTHGGGGNKIDIDGGVGDIKVIFE